jgi:hypothetical protein
MIRLLGKILLLFCMAFFGYGHKCPGSEKKKDDICEVPSRYQLPSKFHVRDPLQRKPRTTASNLSVAQPITGEESIVQAEKIKTPKNPVYIMARELVEEYPGPTYRYVIELKSAAVGLSENVVILPATVLMALNRHRRDKLTAEDLVVGVGPAISERTGILAKTTPIDGTESRPVSIIDVPLKDNDPLQYYKKSWWEWWGTPIPRAPEKTLYRVFAIKTENAIANLQLDSNGDIQATPENLKVLSYDVAVLILDKPIPRNHPHYEPPDLDEAKIRKTWSLYTNKITGGRPDDPQQCLPMDVSGYKLTEDESHPFLLTNEQMRLALSWDYDLYGVGERTSIPDPNDSLYRPNDSLAGVVAAGVITMATVTGIEYIIGGRFAVRIIAPLIDNWGFVRAALAQGRQRLEPR